MKSKTLVLVLAGMSILLFGLMATAAGWDIPALMPGEGSDGVITLQELPATVNVVDRNGKYAGIVRRSDLETDAATVNVYDEEGSHVGYFGPNGFYKLDSEPIPIEGKETWIEEHTDDLDNPVKRRQKNE